MKTILYRSCSFVIAFVVVASAALAQDKVPLKTQLPRPLFVGTPVPLNVPNLEPPMKGKRPDFMVPTGTLNLAKGKKVTASDSNPVTRNLDLSPMVTRPATKAHGWNSGPANNGCRSTWLKSANIYAVLLWHFHSQARVYRDVVVQVSNDPTFKSGVTTIFNNDFKGELGAGTGKDLNYVETYQGKLIDAKGANGRYVRLYSNGNTTNKLNDYIEVEVWGKPA